MSSPLCAEGCYMPSQQREDSTTYGNEGKFNLYEFNARGRNPSAGGRHWHFQVHPLRVSLSLARGLGIIALLPNQMTNLRVPLKRSDGRANGRIRAMRYETFIVSARDSSHI